MSLIKTISDLQLNRIGKIEFANPQPTYIFCLPEEQ